MFGLLKSFISSFYGGNPTIDDVNEENNSSFNTSNSINTTLEDVDGMNNSSFNPINTKVDDVDEKKSSISEGSPINTTVEDVDGIKNSSFNTFNPFSPINTKVDDVDGMNNSSFNTVNPINTTVEDEEEKKSSINESKQIDIGSSTPGIEGLVKGVASLSLEPTTEKAELQGSQKSVKLESIVLDSDKNGNPPQPVEVHPSLVRVLKKHQAEGISFMYDSTFGSVDRLEEDGGGGILAHCMGLGKTLQVIAFLHTIMNHPKIGPKVVELDRFKTDVDRHHALSNWHRSEEPSVVIVGYDRFRILTTVEDDEGEKRKNGTEQGRKEKDEIFVKRQADFRYFLQDPDHCMVSFVKPGLLGTKKNFANQFANPIDRGRTKDATSVEVRLMKYRCYILFEHLKKYVDRKDYMVLKEAIPPKQEYVLNVRLTEPQCKLYRAFLENGDLNLVRQRYLLADYHVFSRIWTHPYQLIVHEAEMERRRILRDESEEGVRFPDDRSKGDFTENSESGEERGRILRDESEEDDRFLNDSSKGDFTENSESGEDRDVTCGDDEPGPSNSKPMQASQHLAEEGAEVAALSDGTPPEYSGWFSKLGIVTEDHKEEFSLSNKLILLATIIKKCEEIGDKLIVFSQSLESLSLIKRMLDYYDSKNSWFINGHEALEGNEHWGWKEGYDYMTIDGSVQSSKRDKIQTQFNDPKNLRARLMLISTKAGSLGTNMVSANRVVIFDACWNPSHDTQSVFRVYRLGQTKPVYSYRFVAQGTMEERIYKRQVTKESTSMRVVDEAQIERHYEGDDLAGLYKFDPKEIAMNQSQCPAYAPPKDRLLAEVLHEQPDSIADFFPHDTLFANVDDEKLTDEECREAWKDYERENNGIRSNQSLESTAKDLHKELSLYWSTTDGLMKPEHIHSGWSMIETLATVAVSNASLMERHDALLLASAIMRIALDIFASRGQLEKPLDTSNSTLLLCKESEYVPVALKLLNWILSDEMDHSALTEQMSDDFGFLVALKSQYLVSTA